MPDCQHLLLFIAAGLAAEPHAGAGRAVHRDQRAALGRARRHRRRPGHHGRLLRPHLRGGGGRRRAAGDLGHGVRGAQVGRARPTWCGSGVQAAAVARRPRSAGSAARLAARRRAAAASWRCSAAASGPTCSIPKVAHLLPGLRAAVHRARRRQQGAGLRAAGRAVQHQRHPRQFRLGAGRGLDGRARRRVQRGMHWLDRVAGAMFIGFGIKLALSDNPS